MVRKYANKAPYGGVSEATRYCGRVTVRCSYDDGAEQYKCNLSVGGKRRGIQYVGGVHTRGGRRLAVDSPDAFDEVAHAALSFALDDGQIDESDIAWHSGGGMYEVRRKR